MSVRRIVETMHGKNNENVLSTKVSVDANAPEEYQLLGSSVCCVAKYSAPSRITRVFTKYPPNPGSVLSTDMELQSGTDKGLSHVTICLDYPNSCTADTLDQSNECGIKYFCSSCDTTSLAQDHSERTLNEYDLSNSCWSLATLIAAAVAFSFVLGAQVVCWQMTFLLENALKTCEQKKAEMTTTDRICASSAMINGLCSVYRFFAKMFN